MSRNLGIYIHIPFCRSKCDYCDFYSLAGRESLMPTYQKALLTHIKETAQQAHGYQVDSVYFGGGTPSYYGTKRLGELIAAIRRRFSLAPGAEITVECNPESVDKKNLTRLRRAGVTRISVGMQSASDEDLACLHRPHTFEQTAAAVHSARGAKIKNVSLDLIFGLPGQTNESWQRTVEQALALMPDHLSCYGLKVEPGTPLAGRVSRGEALPDDDAQADMYLWTISRLEAAGFRQYEISNFAKQGRESRHNLKYWMGRPYIGFGPGAHSDFGGVRYSFVKDLDVYIKGVLEGGQLIDDSALVPMRERGGEYLMLRLRTTRGIEEWEYRREFFMNFDPVEAKLTQYEQRGWITQENGRWRFTPQGFLLSNQLIGELMACQKEATLETLLPKVRQAIPTENQAEKMI